ncbi:urea carboxylase [Acinetobacter larvae]|uniref:Biotin carboxylase n=1 Tax=Acinetobacter larvae TaxID=1789224 RepID=A0A1B2LZ10_9GAMM|nr:urea carboxylase [Acinetobacter larvae]AOA58151.1 urea carboxylase [Acinetobacter larvae]
MFHTILIANRGEIALRAIRTCKKMGIRTVAVYAETDRYAQHVKDADLAIDLQASHAADSYLSIEKIIQAAKDSAADAIFPGYGFLSESAEFATACQHAGIVFIGPRAEHIRQFGLKHQARLLAAAAQVPMTPGSALLNDIEEALAAAQQIGYPIMLKSTAGGGGIGLCCCQNQQQLQQAFAQVKRLGQQYFKDAGVFLERYIEQARHIEVQILGDGQGQVVALGERDCSLQRRNQKVIEETPAPNLPASTRQKMQQAAVALAQSVNYLSAATVEFIYEVQRDEFYFLEVNTRLQVEHPITEMVTGIDLVACMIRIAAGECLDWAALNGVAQQGCAIEARLYAENPIKDFQPSPGRLTEVYFPEDVRVDHWLSAGTEVSTYFDPMLAKVIVHAEDRPRAIAKLQRALAATRLSGICTNLDYVQKVLQDPHFQAAQMFTRLLDDFKYQPHMIEVLAAGAQSSIQDYPGRVGYWDIGVPPSGPMDDYAFRMANQIVGNDPTAAGFEFSLYGPSLKFHCDAVIAITGAPCQATLDGIAVAFWQPIAVSAGQVLSLGAQTAGCRSYLAVQHGLDVPLYLGSRATFSLGALGGHAGRCLQLGDMIAIFDGKPTAHHQVAQAMHSSYIPDYPQHWHIAVLYGPHGAPDFFQPDSIEEFFSTAWTVHFNSNRLGIRLSGPTPRWTRPHGGEAGLHPSNVHDCEYAIGAINFTGDFAVILAKDGPSLGGFVCPLTIASAELWKMGQLKADDRVSFYPVSIAEANQMARTQQAQIANFTTAPEKPSASRVASTDPSTLRTIADLGDCILASIAAEGGQPQVQYRQAGDQYILLEYGEDILDLGLRLRVHQLMQQIENTDTVGILELAPGVRSLQIKYDSLQLPQAQLLELLIKLEYQLEDTSQLKIPSRILHLPMAFEDAATLGAVARYQQSVCAQAPWLPNNVDFLQQINGLDHREQVKDILYSAHYLILGLGDVYLSAPCAVPLDPRHRLLGSKYNPARTFTPEGTVGIGGMYMCIYGMDSPGGYQLVGRTLPIWNKYQAHPQFAQQPWFLRFFDQIKYFPVSEAELSLWRADFEQGLRQIEIEETVFDYAAYQQFLLDQQPSIDAFQHKQQQAFQQQAELWQQQEVTIQQVEDENFVTQDYSHLTALTASMTGNIWKILVEQEQCVKKGETIAIIEAMKMELPVYATDDGVVKAILCRAGQTVHCGEPLLYMA